jgi:hypothetical protein
MTMQIKTTFNFICWFICNYSLLYLVDLRVHQFWCISPSPVHINACDIASWVPINYPIYIYHWKYFNYMSLEQPLKMLIWFWNQISDHPFHHVWWPYLNRVLSSYDYNHLLILLLGFSSYRHLWDIVTTNWSAHWFYIEL